jgi:hypothetical protein
MEKSAWKNGNTYRLVHVAPNSLAVAMPEPLAADTGKNAGPCPCRAMLPDHIPAP